ncbi:unnamed protein product [Pleuronectes platessa]|uniref:Uncharacterized protein n=1 Tax=Pleuronectes platessa TaxID=8262 RepID=A0A9N7W0L3_PLEPL|nr:unnamed protein product [Pleuronectes platessa]
MVHFGFIITTQFIRSTVQTNLGSAGKTAVSATFLHMKPKTIQDGLLAVVSLCQSPVRLGSLAVYAVRVQGSHRTGTIVAHRRQPLCLQAANQAVLHEAQQN